MKADNLLFAGAFVTIGIAAAALMGVPYIELSDVKPPKGLKPYTSAELRGRQQVVEPPTHLRLLVDRHRAPPRDRRPDHPQGRQLPGHDRRPRRVGLPAPRGPQQLEREDRAGAW